MLSKETLAAIEAEVSKPAPDSVLCACGLRELLIKGAEIGAAKSAERIQELEALVSKLQNPVRL